MTDPLSRSEPTQTLNDLATAWMEEQRKIASVEAERLGQALAAALAEVRSLSTVRDELEVARVELDTAWKQIARFRAERDKAESACIAAERALKTEKEAHDAARVTFAKAIENVRGLSEEDYSRLSDAASPPPSVPTIAWLTKHAHDNACAKGFWDGTSPGGRWENPGTVPTQLALIHSEVSEALEAWRENDRGSTRPDGKPDGFITELADAVIRCFDTAGALGMDLETAVLKKMAFNETRPHRHGGKRA